MTTKWKWECIEQSGAKKKVDKCIWRLKITETVLLRDVLTVSTEPCKCLVTNNLQNGEFLSRESVKGGYGICPDQKESHGGVGLGMLRAVTTASCLTSEDYDNTYSGDEKEWHAVLILK